MTGIEAWCNGNTQDFGSWFGGSSPLASTKESWLEHLTHNQAVVGSIPAWPTQRSDGGIGRHEGLKIPWPVMAVRVQVPLGVLIINVIYDKDFKKRRMGLKSQ